jgi:hypothetical protein
MIDGYGFGRLTVGGREYRSDLILLPEGVRDSWRRRQGHGLCLQDLEEALRCRPEALVIGQGKPGLMKVPPELVAELRRRGIEVFVAPTERAVREYNRLCGLKRTVAALHLTC